MDYGRAIRIARSTRGWSQSRLAKEIQLTPSHISLVESGFRAPSTDTLERVSGSLGVPMHLLMLLAGDEKNLRGIDEGQAQQLGRWMLGFLQEPPTRSGVPREAPRQAEQMPLSWGFLERVLRTSRGSLRALARTAGSHYRPFSLARPGKKARPIDNPTQKLKAVQSRIYTQILRTAAIPDTMLGGISGKTILDNAAPHRGQPCVVTLDLKSCFRRIPCREVFRVFRSRFGGTDSFANLLTKLTTFRDSLPQGAPTSTLLAVLCLMPMHDEIRALAARLGLQFTQWLDDLTLSGEGAEAAISAVVEIVRSHGHGVGTGKVRVMWRGQLQVVTGIVVNSEELRAPRKFLEATEQQMLALLKGTAIEVRDWQSVMGKIGHIQFVSRTQALRLRARARRWGFPLVAPRDMDPPAGASRGIRRT